jgi:hypothetical protein
MNRTFVLYALAGGAAAAFLATGLWPFFDAKSFYDEIAEFPPYNAHFLHDVGAFQVGIGATLLLALLWRSDALLVALGGSGIGAAFHFVAHIRDHDEGGTDGQAVALGVFAALLLLGAAWQWWRTLGGADSAGTPGSFDRPAGAAYNRRDAP